MDDIEKVLALLEKLGERDCKCLEFTHYPGGHLCVACEADIAHMNIINANGEENKKA